MTTFRGGWYRAGKERSAVLFESFANRSFVDSRVVAKKASRELRNPTQHLDILEEVWWLGCWSGIENIAVLLTTRESRRRSSSDQQLRNEKATPIKSHFRGPDVEDESFFFVFDVPYHIPGRPV
jgi:hypothetical protein